jgi:hypothetical protein
LPWVRFMTIPCRRKRPARGAGTRVACVRPMSGRPR